MPVLLACLNLIEKDIRYSVIAPLYYRVGEIRTTMAVGYTKTATGEYNFAYSYSGDLG
jgi:hypothetical protein